MIDAAQVAEVANSLDFWKEYGPLGVMFMLQTGALGWMGTWLVKRVDRQDTERVQLVREGQAQLKEVAAINATTATVLSQLVDKVDGMEGDLSVAVASTSASHAETHRRLQEIRAKMG